MFSEQKGVIARHWKYRLSSGRLSSLLDSLTGDEPPESIRITWRQVEKDIERYDVLRRCQKTRDKIVEVVRDWMKRADWNDDWRRGNMRPYELALTEVLSWQDFFRKANGRDAEGRTPEEAVTAEAERPRYAPGDLPVGPVVSTSDPVNVTVLPYVPPKEPDAYIDADDSSPPPMVLAAAETPTFGYEGDGTRNGGVSGHGAIWQVEEDKEKARKEKPVHGVAAFATVGTDDGTVGAGLPELAWHYSASAFEIGVSSNFDTMLHVLFTGQTIGSSGEAPEMPTEIQQRAAGRQTQVRRDLRKLWPSLKTVIDIAYEDRRCKQDKVTEHGHGVANLLDALRSVQRDLQESPQGETLLALQRFLIVLCRREAPKAAKGKQRKRKKKPRSVAVPFWPPVESADAADWLKGAHRAYLSLAETPPQRPRPKRPKRPRREPGRLVAVGGSGRGRRVLVEVAAEAA